MKKNHFILILILFIFACNKSKQSESSLNTTGNITGDESKVAAVQKVKEYYTCGMHPEVHTEHPGECPICHMTLEKKTIQAEDKPTKEKKIKFYRHPMTPEVHSQVPAKDNMGMDYIAVYEEEDTPQESHVSGRGQVVLTKDQEIVAGIAVVSAEEKEIEKQFWMSGRLIGGSQVSFQVFEEDLSAIKPGQKFSAKSASLAGIELLGVITSIESLLDPMSRTGRVIGNLTTTQQGLRAESTIMALVKIPLGKGVVIPEGAVVHTGAHNLVYVLSAPGRYSPREVSLGSRFNGHFHVLQGLKAQEQIAAGPNFLLDSESRIRATYDQKSH